MSTAGPTHLPKPGDRLLGKFRIDRIVGQGGAGVVFAAHHELLDQPIALKLLLAEAGSETALRFVNEAKLAAKIHSEHVCRVMDVGMLESGLPYIAMEYLEGQDLDAVIEVGAVPLARACDYVMQALEAVAQAHAQGIVHRDLKPSNLFLAKMPAREMPIVKVLDFGISKGDFLGGETDVTSSRAILGSPSYMSPEQIKNARTVDARADIWAVGVILYELTSGHPPFGGETVGEVFAKILEGEPISLRSVAPHLPEAFEAVVMTCLRRDREQRYASVAELADALAPFSSESAPELLTSIHGVSPLLLALAESTRQPKHEPTRNESKSEPKQVPATSATAAPWIEAREPKPRRGKGRALLVLVLTAFGGGGASVYYLGRAPNLASNVEAMASGAVAAGTAPIDSAAAGLLPLLGAAGTASAAPLVTPTPGEVFDAAVESAAPDGNAAPAPADASSDAPLDGPLDASDASDDGSVEDEEEEEEALDAGVGTRTAPRVGAPRPTTTKKPTTVKKKTTKRRVRR